MIDLLRSNHIMILSNAGARLIRRVMEWSARTPASPASDARMGRVSNGAPPCPTNQSRPLPLSIDIGKNSFHVAGLDRRGAIVLPQNSPYAKGRPDQKFSLQHRG